MLAAVSPRTDRSSHKHGTRGKPGPAAPPAPLARMGGWPPGTLRNGHATRMSPDRGHCRGSGLNDVHRGVGGTVVTVSSPYAKFMTHNALLSIPGRLGCAGGPFCPCGRQIKTDSIRRKQRRLTHKSREKTDAQSHAFARDRGAVRGIGADRIAAGAQNFTLIEPAAYRGWGPYRRPGFTRVCGRFRCWCRPC